MREDIIQIVRADNEFLVSSFQGGMTSALGTGATLEQAIDTVLAGSITPRQREALQRLRKRAEDAQWNLAVLFP